MSDAEPGHEQWDDDVAEVVRRELLLLDPAVRVSRARVLALLHPDFVEFGASGRRWDDLGIVASLQHEAQQESTGPDERDQRVVPHDVGASRLAPDVVLVTYEARHPARASLRSSVWVRAGGAWVLRFHQGTPTSG